MPVIDPREASDVDALLGRALTARRPDDLIAALRSLFVEKLDFSPASQSVQLDDALRADARRIATREGVQVVAVQFPHADRLRTRDIRTALKSLSQTLTGEILLAATDAAQSRIDLVYPDTKDGRDVLRRMVVRQDEPRRTVAQQIAGIYESLERGDPVTAALSRAYDVEAVTRRFFVEYKRAFDRVMALVQGIPDENERRLFCQTLFNRLMFLYFLQRKGWLTFGGDREYLEALWASHDPEESFYDVRLKLLFFTALSNAESRAPNVDDYTDHLIGSVPFLNGGLFEEKEIDRREGVVVPDEAIGLILNQLFRRFNFTIQESTPYDVEVAVDPEMLGKVFEELVTGRHETGSYYTPRPIVSFMCREGLKGYLTAALTASRGNATQSGGGRDSANNAADVTAFVDDHKVDSLSVSDARVILEALESVTVLDPACGSGAYLLGMLHELVDLQSLLYSERLRADATSLHQLKLRIIQNNLYGADIDPFAVNIAMLRLWLSLAIEFNSTSAPPPLPNLDFKIVRGDSLTAPNPSPSLQPDLFRFQAHQDADEIAELKRQHMRATGDEKRTLADQIRQKQTDLKDVLGSDAAPTGSVDWRIQFAEVFDRRGGFDVVIANPPYVRMELFKSSKPTLKKYFPLVHSDRSDLYVYFYGRAVDLLRNDGALVFISSNKWLRTGYGKRLRSFLGSRLAITHVVDFGDLPVFESASAYPMILVGFKGADELGPMFTHVTSLGVPYPDVLDLTKMYGSTLPASSVQSDTWQLIRSPLTNRSSARSDLTTLVTYANARVLMGIKTGLNEAFIIGNDVRDQLINSNPGVSQIIKPFVTGRNVRRWNSDPKGTWLIYTFHGVNVSRYKNLLAYLAPFRSRLEARATKQPWYELQQPQGYYMNQYEAPKIIFPDIAQRHRFSLDCSGQYPANTAYVIPVADLFLLGLLNSTVVEEFYLTISAQVRGGYVRFFRQYVERIPIPLARVPERHAIESLVQQCLDAKGQGSQVTEWEAEIDERVAWLYGLKSPPGRPEAADDDA